MHRLPWFDGFAALTAGVLVLALHRFLAELYRLPVSLVLIIGAVNVLYCVPGLALGVMQKRSAALLKALIAANLFWGWVCCGLVVRFGSQASVFGLVQLIGEGLFVTGLAALEWEHQETILHRGILNG